MSGREPWFDSPEAKLLEYAKAMAYLDDLSVPRTNYPEDPRGLVRDPNDPRGLAAVLTLRGRIRRLVMTAGNSHSRPDA